MKVFKKFVENAYYEKIDFNNVLYQNKRIVLKYFIFYLKTDGDRYTERGLFIHWVTPQMFEIVGAGPGQS